MVKNGNSNMICSIKKDLRGSDVEWREYHVLEGRVPGLILNDEEIQWLRKVWAEAKARE